MGGRHHHLGAGQATILCGRRRRRRLGIAVFGQRRGEDGLALGHAGEQALALLVVAELGDRHGAEDHGGVVRHGRHRASDLLEHEGGLQDAEAAAADILGEGDPDQSRLGQLGPQVAVEPLGRGLDLLQALVGDLVAQDLGGQLLDLLLLLAEREVHYKLLGILRPKTAMRSRCTSLVPPPKVRISVPW